VKPLERDLTLDASAPGARLGRDEALLPVVTGSGETALIVAVRLPLPLERLRQQGVRDAPFGLPAHATLLYPFAPPEALDDELRARVARIVAAHEVFSYELVGRGRWPDTLYAAIEPTAPFRAPQGDLAAAFPAFPIYGGAFEYVPHVTIAEGPAANEPGIVAARAWASLPVARTARFVDLIVQEGGRWTVRSRFPLRGPGSGRCIPLIASAGEACRR
jgi:2'-5' RNA ligase